MLSVTILGLSIALQFFAAVLALRLIRTTERWWAWSFVAIALTLMGVRRSITFYRVVSNDASLPVDISAELVGLGISVLMVSGVLMIGPLFKHMKQSKKHLHSIIDNSPSYIVLKDRNGRVQIGNRKYGNVFNLQVPDIIGKTSMEFLPETIAKNSRAHDRRVLEMQSELTVERRIPTEQGMRDFIVTKFPILDEEDAVVGLGTIGTDITERKQAEEKVRKLSQAVEQSAAQVIITDAGGTIEFVNPKFVEVTGYSAEEAIGKTPRILKSEHTSAKTHKELWAAITSGQVWRGELQNKRKDGSLYWDSSSISPIKAPDGKITHYLSIKEDITEYKLIEAQLRQAQKMEVVGQLTGGVAHDFNNLLGVMMGNSERLEDEIGENENARHQLKAIQQAVDRAASLTNRLLAFSRQQTLSPRPTAVNGLVLGLEDMLQRTLGETIELQAVLGSGTCDAMIDPHQFENALINLAVNARDAMPQGGKLTIETATVTLDEAYAEQHQEVTPGDYVMVAVNDTGTGMPPEVLEKVFEPFFTTKDVGEGSGLGLSMVYGFVKQSNGHVTIFGEVGHGTTVKLYMPRSREAVTRKDADKDTPEFAPGSERILVVEDDESVREIPATILRDHGYEVVEAADARQAVRHLKDGPPFDLLFTDIVLPGGMNGVEIAEQAIRIQPGIRVLYTTGYAENSVVHHGRLDPANTLVNKPYRRAELLEKVRAMLDGKDV